MKKIQVGDLILGDGDVKVCLPMAGATLEEIISEAAYVKASPCHLAEWRVDFFENSMQEEKVMETLAQIKNVMGEKPLLFTFRTAGDGGAKEVDAAYYFHLNQMILESGLAEAVDLELAMGREAIAKIADKNKDRAAKLFISKHIFEGTPSEKNMIRIMLEMKELGADVAKLAVMALSRADVEKTRNCTLFMQKNHQNIPFILIAMGELGKITRRRKPFAGTVITYAKGRNSEAPGQLSVEELFGE